MNGASPRPYRSPRREDQARATRRAIADAARTLFLERGWAGTKVRAVAEAAGVAEPTVYAVYGNKAGLALALLDAVDDAGDVERVRAEVEAAAGDPRAQLAASVRFDCRLFTRAGDVMALLRDGGRTTPELAAAYSAGVERGDRARLAIFAAWPRGTLHAGLTPQDAVDVYAATCNIDSWRVLCGDRGWSARRAQSWWVDALAQLLLDERA